MKPEPGVPSGSNSLDSILSSAGKGKWNVQVGSLTISIKQSELTLNDQPKLNLKASVSYDLVSDSTSGNKPVFELRLLGMRAEEAIRAMDRQIDLCILSNFKNFSIIHGKGNGILQQTVHDYLSNCPTVSEFKFASAEDGGFGKTYVTLH